MEKFEIVLMLVVIIPSLFTFSIFFYHPQLHAKVLDFYDIGEINKYNVITICIQNPTNKTYVLVPIINSHRWYPNVSYPALTDVASCFKAPPCPEGRGQSSTGTKGGSHPEYDANPQYPNMLFDGAEAYHIDPRFNRGVSVTLAPSTTIIKRNFDKEVFKCEGAIHPRLREARLSAPLTPFLYNTFTFRSTSRLP